MLRGHRTYLSLFQSESPAEVLAVPEKRGRSEALVKKRNELLLHRHYFKYKIKRLQYQDGLDQLEDEFFITERTIIDIVQSDCSVLKNLKAINPPDAKYFKRKYPFMNWE